MSNLLYIILLTASAATMATPQPAKNAVVKQPTEYVNPDQDAEVQRLLAWYRSEADVPEAATVNRNNPLAPAPAPAKPVIKKTVITKTK